MEAVAAKRADVARAQTRRDALRAEAEAIAEELGTTVGADGKPVGLTSRLVDDEGFPRADVDLMRVRTLRHRAHVLRTDLRAVEEELSRLVLELHEAASKVPKELLAEYEAAASRKPQPQAARASAEAGAGGGAPRAPSEDERPFAAVRDVAAGSPAGRAGLRPGLMVTRFGDVGYASVRAAGGGLGPVAGQVREGVAVQVVVLESLGAAPKTLTLTPARWAGQGLLGCFLVPV